MITLHLGVLDVGYSDAQSGNTSTGDVAAILEANYHVMETFYELRKDKITQWITDSMAQQIEMVMSGRGSSTTAHGGLHRHRQSHSEADSLTYSADQKIEAEFRSFLDSNEMSRIFGAFTGSPLSAAAEAGVSHRRKFVAGKWQIVNVKRRGPRPAFIDTGLYRISFRAWTTAGKSAPLPPLPAAQR